MTDPMTTADVLAARNEFLSSAYLTYFADDPLHIRSGQMQHVFTPDGVRLFDATGSIVTISAGHCHPQIVGAARRQMGELQHATTLYAEEQLVQAARRLVGIAPEQMQKVFFVNSGGEANELAAIYAMMATGNTGLASLHHSFHGRTTTAQALTAQQPWRNRIPMLPDVHHIPNPNIYRKPDGMNERSFLDMCLSRARETMLHSLGGRVAGLWIEPIQGNGGVIHGPNWYYDELIRMVHEFGGVVIADEVQTFARTGKWFACQHWSEPVDIITMAKGLGNGHPVGAVLTTNEVDAKFDGMHFNTHGGNPVSMAIVQAVIDVLETQAGNAEMRAAQLRSGLRTLSEKHWALGDIRGIGTMQGIEIVKQGPEKEPWPEATKHIQAVLRDKGVSIGTGGVNHNVFRFAFPHCSEEEDIGGLLDALDEAFSEVEASA